MTHYRLVILLRILEIDIIIYFAKFSVCLFLPPGIAQEGDYEMHPVCACIRKSVSVSCRFL